MIYRKTNRAKRVDPSCKNHGACKHCEANRLYASRKRMQESVQQVANELESVDDKEAT